MRPLASTFMRILLANPKFEPPGGGGTVAAWFLQVLAAHHDVTTFSIEPVALAEMNRFYGTNVAASDFKSLLVPDHVRAWLRLFPTRGGLLTMHALSRYVRRVVDEFDVVVTAYNEVDVGRPVIQYVHYPWLKLPRPAVEHRWYHQGPALRAYYAACRAISPYSDAGMKANVTLTNSDWTGRVIAQVHGVSSTTLYPPVPGPFRDRPWDEREEAFAIVGRISPEKRVELAIDIVERARARGFDVRLHVAGTVESIDAPYAARIARLADARPWVVRHENLTRPALLDLIGSVRYGLHAMADEHFGIAVAELLLSGTIPFVPDDGGQVEIVGNPALTYHDAPEAVDKIVAVLESRARQDELRRELAARRPRFSIDRFSADLLRIVEQAAQSGVLTMARNAGLRASSSAWVPVSATRPSAR